MLCISFSLSLYLSTVLLILIYMKSRDINIKHNLSDDGRHSGAICVKNEKISCSGSEKDGAEHPLVYMHFGNKEEVICPYCGIKFVREG